MIYLTSTGLTPSGSITYLYIKIHRTTQTKNTTHYFLHKSGIHLEKEKYRQCKYNVIFRSVIATIVAVEKK